MDFFEKDPFQTHFDCFVDMWGPITVIFRCCNQIGPSLGEDRTPQRTQNTRMFFLVARRVAQLFGISRFIHCTCIDSRLESSSQHVSRVLKTLRLLHSHSSISCLVVASCWLVTGQNSLDTDPRACGYKKH